MCYFNEQHAVHVCFFLKCPSKTADAARPDGPRTEEVIPLSAIATPKPLRISIHREILSIPVQEILFVEVFNWKCMIHRTDRRQYAPEKAGGRASFPLIHPLRPQLSGQSGPPVRSDRRQSHAPGREDHSRAAPGARRVAALLHAVSVPNQMIRPGAATRCSFLRAP